MHPLEEELKYVRYMLQYLCTSLMLPTCLILQEKVSSNYFYQDPDDFPANVMNVNLQSIINYVIYCIILPRVKLFARDFTPKYPLRFGPRILARQNERKQPKVLIWLVRRPEMFRRKFRDKCIRIKKIHITFYQSITLIAIFNTKVNLNIVTANFISLKSLHPLQPCTGKT